MSRIAGRSASPERNAALDVGVVSDDGDVWVAPHGDSRPPKGPGFAPTILSIAVAWRTSRSFMVQGRWKLPGRSARAAASRSLPRTRARPAGAPSVTESLGGRPGLAPPAEDRAERRAIDKCLWGPYGRARSAWEQPSLSGQRPGGQRPRRRRFRRTLSGSAPPTPDARRCGPASPSRAAAPPGRSTPHP